MPPQNSLSPGGRGLGRGGEGLSLSSTSSITCPSRGNGHAIDQEQSNSGRLQKVRVLQGQNADRGVRIGGAGLAASDLRHIDIKPEQITIITANAFGREIAGSLGVKFIVEPIKSDTYVAQYDKYLAEGDFLVNASYDVNSLDTIEYCQQRDILYIDACIEPWPGGHKDCMRRGRGAADQLCLSRGRAGDAQQISKGSRVRIDAWSQSGPGIASDQAGVAQRGQGYWCAKGRAEEPQGMGGPCPAARHQGHSYRRAGQPVERAAQGARRVRQHLVERGIRRRVAAAGGTGLGHPRKELACRWPNLRFRLQGGDLPRAYRCVDAGAHLDATRRPDAGLSDFPRRGDLDPGLLHGAEKGKAVYRPTCHYSYHPCDDAVLSMHEYIGNNYKFPPRYRLLRDEISEGMDELRRPVDRTQERRLLVWLAAHHRGRSQALPLQQRDQPASQHRLCLGQFGITGVWLCRPLSLDEKPNRQCRWIDRVHLRF